MHVQSHDLESEFRDHKAQIAELRLSDASFKELLDRYAATNAEVVKAEEADVPMSDFAFEVLKKQRLHLKDELYALLRAHSGTL